MSYQGMTKAQLIAELEERDIYIDRLERDFKEEQMHANLMDSTADMNYRVQRAGIAAQQEKAENWPRWIEEYILPNIDNADPRFSKGTAIEKAIPLIEKEHKRYKPAYVTRKLNTYLKDNPLK